MKAFLMLIFILSALSSVQAENPREWMEEGLNHLRSNEIKAADKAFAKAAETAPEHELEAAVPLYNQALTKLITTNATPEDVSQALNLLRQAERTTDRDLQAKVHYTQGLASAHLAKPSIEKQDLDGALKTLENALESFSKSMLLDPKDLDTKKAFEITDALKKKVEKLKKQQQQQQQQQDQKNQKNQKDQKDQKNKKDKKKGKDQKKPQQGEEQKKDQPQQPDQGKQQEQEKEKASQQPQEQKQDQQQKQGSGEEASEKNPAEQMDARQAQSLMDAMKEEEQARRAQLRLNLGQTVPVDKDW